MKGAREARRGYPLTLGGAAQFAEHLDPPERDPESGLEQIRHSFNLGDLRTK